MIYFKCLQLVDRDIPKGVDQDFLKHHVYGLIKNNSLIHDSFTCAIFDGTAFPSKRVGNCFIGSTDGCDFCRFEIS